MDNLGLIINLATQALRHSELHNLTHQSQWQRLVQRKLHRPLGAFVFRQLTLKSRNPIRTWVKPNMLFVPCKMHQITIQLESRHLVTDRLSRAGRRFLNGLAHLLEQGLHLWRELCDVGVYGIKRLVNFFHNNIKFERFDQIERFV